MRKQNVAYLRVSTEAQTEKYGLDMQKQKIIEYCEQNGISIDRWYIDGGYSGSKLDRPKIQELLDDAENGWVAKVFIYKLDRMSRDVIDTLNLLYRILPKLGVEVVSMTEDLKIENPIDRVMIGVNAIMGQYEREIIHMRTRAGMKERVKKGLWMGGGRTPFGYYYDRNDGILHPHPEQAEIVRKAYDMYIDRYSCDKIAKTLGFSCERIVSQILKRKTNIGIIQYNGEEYKGMHEPIVDEQTFYKAQDCMKKRCTNSHIANNHILTGLCYCGICGARMRYQKWGKYHKIVCYSQYKSGKEYMIKDSNCNNLRANADDVEKEVKDCFKQFALRANNEEIKKIGRTEETEDIIKRINLKIKKYYSIYVENESDNLLELIKEEEKRVSFLQKQLKSEKEKERMIDIGKIERIKNMSHIWEELTSSEKNMVLKECVKKIVITGNDIDIFFETF